MPARNAGSAFVKIRPDATDFVKDLRRDLAAVNDPGFEVKVHADTSAAYADIEKFRIGQERDAVNLKVKVDRRSQDDVLKQVTSLMGEVGKAASAVGGTLKFPLLLAGIGELPAATLAITNVAGALQQLSGAALVVPGAIAGIGAVVGTVKLGMVGLEDAFTALAKSSDGSIESMAELELQLQKLAPSAAEFVRAIGDIRPEFDALQKDIQGRMFEGLGDQIRHVATADLPILKRGLGGIADALNDNLKQIGATLSSDRSQGLLDRILGNTADAQARLSAAIDPLVNAFGTLAAAGTDALPRLADGLTGVAERFENFITTADADGRLDKWINEGIDGFKHVGESILSIGDILGSITKAAGGDGGLLKMLDDGTAKLAAFLNSPQGQNQLKEWFDEGRRQIGDIIDFAKEAGPALADIFRVAKDAADTLVPAITAILDAINAIPGGAGTVVGAFVAWKTIEGVAALTSSLKTIVNILQVGLPTAAAAGGASAAAALAPLAAAASTIAGVWAFLGIGQSMYNNASDEDKTLGNTGVTTDDLANSRTGGRGTSLGNATAPPTPGSLSPSTMDKTRTLPETLNPALFPGIQPTQSPGPTAPFPFPLPVPSGRSGGPTPSGRGPGPTGGFLAEIHPNEWVLPAHARAAVGDSALWALTSGRSFEGGGYVDQYGNPVTPGPAPGPGVVAPVAPNPTGQSGSVPGVISKVVSGIQGPIGNALNVGMGLYSAFGQQGGTTGVQTQHGAGTILQPSMPTFADRMATVPGLAGLFGSLGSSNPGENLMNWGVNTGQWLGNWAANTIGGFGSALWQGALGFVGLENSILSPSNVYNQAAQQTAGFFLGQQGPLGALMGQQGQGVNGFDTQLAAAQKQQGGPLDFSKLPKGVGNERGLQINTIRAKRAISAAFPAISEIGGVREDALKWHPNGLAIDVMVPGWDTPEGKAYGDKIYQFVMAHKDELGVDYVLWQEKDHYNHLHVNTTGGGYPTAPGYESGGEVKTWQDLLTGGGRPRGYDDTMARLVNGGIGGYLPAKPTAPFGASKGIGYDVPAGPGNINPNFKIDTSMASLAPLYNSPRVRSSWTSEDFFDQAYFDEAEFKQLFRPVDANEPLWNFFRGWAGGGGIPGFGVGDTVPAMLTPGEHVLTTSDVKAMGGQDGVYAFRRALHFAAGGNVPAGVVVQPPPPNFGTVSTSRPAPVPAAPTSPAPSAPGQVAPTPSTPVATPPTAPQAPVQTPFQAAPGVAPAPDSLNHNLPAVSTAISSGASAIGQALSTAIGLAAGAAGSSGFAPGAGALGAIGPYAAGLVQQGGKIVDDAANVVSSFLVGNVPGSFGDPNLPAYGRTLRPEQNAPATAAPRGNRTNNFYGMDIPKVFQELDVREAQDSQAILAGYRG